MVKGQLVAPRHQTIFNGDPLLLWETNQLKYGRAMLEHLLVFRPLTTSAADIVDLFANPTGSAGSTIHTVTTNMEAVYRAAFDQRKSVKDSGYGLTPKEIDTLYDITMVSNESTEARKNIAYRNHQSAKALLAAPSVFDDRLRVAAIGMRVRISKLRGKAQLREELQFMDFQQDAQILSNEEIPFSQLGRTEVTSHADLSDWRNSVIEQIEQSLGQKSDFVVLPEFGLPPDPDARNTIDALISAASSQRHFDDHFISAGTRHEDRYNRGPVLSKRHGKNSKVGHWHYKIASARSLGENVLGQAGITIRNYETGTLIGANEMEVAIGVCYDTYDPSIFLSLFLNAVRRFQGAIPRIVLVPSFNPSPDFVALLRDLSFLSRSAVVYVNGLHGDSRMFMCGYDIEDFATRLPVIIQSLADRRSALSAALAKLDAKDKTNGGLNRRDRRQHSRWTKQELDVQVFEQRLSTLQRRGDLDNLITIEDCPKCRFGTPHTDKACFRNIAYYNLPRGLLSAISDFRIVYFGDEEFIPEPLRWEKLDESAKQLDAS